MKPKLLICALAAAVTLCACQPETATTPTRSPGPTSEVTASAAPPPGEEISAFPPAPQVCKVPFTETESFPYPFEDELYVDDKGTLYLSAEQALYDYGTMWALLEENFPYFSFIKDELEIDWQDVRDEYRSVLERRLTDEGYISQQSFFNTIVSALYQCHGADRATVGHLYAISPSLRQNLLTLNEIAEGSLYKNISYMAANPKTALFYKHLEALYPQNAQTSGGSAAEPPRTVNITDEKSVSPGVTTGYIGSVPYIKMSTFSGWTEKTYAFVDEFISEIFDCENLIIDIQGNGGGSDGAWMWSLVAPLAKEDLTWYWLLGQKTGSLNRAINPGMTEIACNDDSWREEFPYIRPESVEEMDVLIKHNIRVNAINEQEPFGGKIWVLADESCYSAADAFVNFCKYTGFATTVGRPTSGNGIGGQPYTIALPYSGMLVYYDPNLGFNPDGTCNGIYGTTPDIVLEGNQSAIQACLAAIQGG